MLEKALFQTVRCVWGVVFWGPGQQGFASPIFFRKRFCCFPLRSWAFLKLGIFPLSDFLDAVPPYVDVEIDTSFHRIML